MTKVPNARSAKVLAPKVIMAVGAILIIFGVVNQSSLAELFYIGFLIASVGAVLESRRYSKNLLVTLGVIVLCVVLYFLITSIAFSATENLKTVNY
jgi:hypothetical protein